MSFKKLRTGIIEEEIPEQEKLPLKEEKPLEEIKKEFRQKSTDNYKKKYEQLRKRIEIILDFNKLIQAAKNTETENNTYLLETLLVERDVTLPANRDGRWKAAKRDRNICLWLLAMQKEILQQEEEE